MKGGYVIIKGKNIYELRKREKLSQEEIAEKINVSRQTISNWETGQTVPDLYQAKELANILNISIDELVENNDDREEKEELLINKENKNSDSFFNVSGIWNQLKSRLLEYNISKTSYDIWFAPIVEAKVNDTKFIIYSDDEIAVRHINEYYLDILLKIIQIHYSKDIKEVKIEFKRQIIIVGQNI